MASSTVPFMSLPDPEFTNFKLLLRAWAGHVHKDANVLWESWCETVSRHHDLLYAEPLGVARKTVTLSA